MILLVDDDKDLLESNLLGLQSRRSQECLGKRVFAEFTDPVKALAFAHELVESGRAWLLDLVVTDYDMPGMNGVELATEVRELIPNVPILFFTGNPQKTMLSFDNSLIRAKGCSIKDLVDDIVALLEER